MAYQCPRCGKDVQSRWPKLTELAGGPSAGLLYVLLGPLFRSHHCSEHGRIPRAEFPAAQRQKMWLHALLWLAVALVAVAALGWVLVRIATGT